MLLLRSLTYLVAMRRMEWRADMPTDVPQTSGTVDPLAKAGYIHSFCGSYFGTSMPTWLNSAMENVSAGISHRALSQLRKSEKSGHARVRPDAQRYDDPIQNTFKDDSVRLSLFCGLDRPNQLVFEFETRMPPHTVSRGQHGPRRPRELRLAFIMKGGVRLAVWMGRVIDEIPVSSSFRSRFVRNCRR